MSARGRLAVAALALVVVAAAAADLLPYGPEQTRTEQGVEVLRPPSARHWLGTDDRGRDVVARLAHGARTSLFVAAGALALALVVGVGAGAAAAVRRGAVDAVVVGACDVIGSIPPLLLVVAAQGLVGHASFPALVALVALPRAADVARLSRAELARALAAPHAEAARALGASTPRLLLRHGLPLAAPQLAVLAAMIASSAVLYEAALTFLGFGTPPPTASWGELLRQAHQHHLLWWLALPAGAAVSLVALASHTLADELHQPLTAPAVRPPTR